MIDFVIGVIACIFGAEVVVGVAFLLWTIWEDYRRHKDV